MYMCKTRGLSTAILMSLCFIEEITASSQTHTITLGEYLTFFFFFNESGRSHSLFVLEEVRAYYLHTQTHMHTFYF